MKKVHAFIYNVVVILKHITHGFTNTLPLVRIDISRICLRLKILESHSFDNHPCKHKNKINHTKLNHHVITN
jgi:hypothetical protein